VNSNPTDMKPISAFVAYDWSVDEKDIVWPFIRDQLKKVFEGFKTQKEKHPFKYRVGRMRAHHGADICGSILKRCQNTDIAVFDISTGNANVLFELGVAIGAKGVNSGAVFVFVEKTEVSISETLRKKVPSDLRGYFITSYERTRVGLKLRDARGFQAALRFIIKEAAIQRGMFDSEAADLDLD
jgi:hypothetical protein